MPAAASSSVTLFLGESSHSVAIRPDAGLSMADSGAAAAPKILPYPPQAAPNLTELCGVPLIDLLSLIACGTAPRSSLGGAVGGG
jgi:hypothetical protein